MQIQEYLSRIGYTLNVEVNFNTLRGLQRAHMLTVPFENLDIGLGRKIELDEESLWKKIVIDKRGGFCYELNGLFAWLLKEVGFEVTHFNARDYHEEDDTFGIDFDHLALMVRVPNTSTRWLVDVGYGDNVSQPMDIDNPNEQAEGPRGYWIEPFRGGYQLWQRNYEEKSQRQYYFDLAAHNFPVEYEAACLYHQTSPKSIFTQKRTISLLTEDGRITLSNNDLIVTQNGKRSERKIGEDERPRLLKEHFGVTLF